MLEVILVQDFGPLKTGIARFPVGFRLKMRDDKLKSCVICMFLGKFLY